MFMLYLIMLLIILFQHLCSQLARATDVLLQ